MTDTLNLIIWSLMIIIFGVACYASGYISHWKKISSLLPMAYLGKTIAKMIGAGTIMNFDFGMFWLNEAERGLEEKKGKKGFAQTSHTPFYNSNSPANNKR